MLSPGTAEALMDPVAAAPTPHVEPKRDDFCDGLGRAIMGSQDQFAALSGGRLEGEDPAELTLANFGARAGQRLEGTFESTLLIPEMDRCKVIQPPDGGTVAVFFCRKSLKVPAEDDAVYHRQVEQVGSCLDPAQWSLSPGGFTTEFSSSDPRAPQIEVKLLREFRWLRLKLVHAPPPKLADDAAFCTALNDYLSKAGTNFKGLDIERSPLPAMMECERNERLADCTAYEGEELEVAASSGRYVFELLKKCLPAGDYKGEQLSGKAVLFRHATQKARNVAVQQVDNTTTYPADLRRRAHMAAYEIRLLIGPVGVKK